RKIAFRQRLQRESGATGPNGKNRSIARAFEHDLRALRKLAHDLIKHVSRSRGGPTRGRLRRDRLIHFQVEIGRLEEQLRVFRLDEHLGHGWNGHWSIRTSVTL